MISGLEDHPHALFLCDPDIMSFLPTNRGSMSYSNIMRT